MYEKRISLNSLHINLVLRRTEGMAITRAIISQPVHFHYSDVIMSRMASQITSVSIVFSIVGSFIGPRKPESSASRKFVTHLLPIDSPHKGPVTRKMFPLNDAIMSGKFNINLK